MVESADRRESVNGQRPGRLQMWLIGMIGAIMLFDGFDMQLAAFTAPPIMAEWGLTKPGYGPVLAAAIMGMACGTIVGGWLGDRFGRRWTLILNVAFLGVVTLACAATHNVSELVTLRFISGLGFGAAFPSGIALIVEWMPTKAASKAVSVMTITVPLGMMSGAGVSSWVIPAFGWRSAFVVGGVIPLLLALVLLIMLPESLAFLAIRGSHTKIRTLLRRAWPGLAVAENATFRIAEGATGKGAIREVLTAKNRWVNIGLWLGFLANLMAATGYLGWIPTILTGMGLPLDQAIRGAFYFSSMSILSGIAVPVMIGRYGSRTAAITFASISGAASLIIALGIAISAPHSADLQAIALFGVVVAGIGVGGAQSLLYTLAAFVYPPDCRSTGIGIATSIGRVGSIAAALGGGFLLGLSGGEPFFGTLTLLFATVVLAMLIVDRHIGRTDAAASGTASEPRLPVVFDDQG